MSAAARTVLFGTGASFSAAVLRGLLAQGVDVVSLVVPGTDSPIPVVVPAAPDTAAALAAAQGIPVLRMAGAGDHRLAACVRRLRPDYLLIACFPFRLPAAAASIPGTACLNLHPSLLPRHRGPAPLFWQLRAGEARFGITLHLVSERLDAGAIVLQQSVALPDGIGGAEADARLAELGVALFVQALDMAARHGLRSMRQDESLASYEPGPAPEDFRIPTSWPARRAFNFVRGTEHWNQPYEVTGAARSVLIASVLDFTESGRLGADCRQVNGELRLQFSPGILGAVAHSRLLRP